MNHKSTTLWLGVAAGSLFATVCLAVHSSGVIPRFLAATGGWALLGVGVLFGVAGFITGRRQHNQRPGDWLTRQLRDAIDGMTQGVAVLDHRGRICHVNSMFTVLTGLDADQLTGKPFQPGDLTCDDEESPPWVRMLKDGAAVRSARMTSRMKPGQSLSIGASPLPRQGQAAGVLVHVHDSCRIYQRQENIVDLRSTLRESAQQVRALNAELEQLSLRDATTGVFHRRAFFELFDTQWSESRRRRDSLACVMVDIDDFREINATHSTRMGDEVLRKVAATLQETARETDLVSRFNGEEFVVLMPHTSLDDAALIGERMRQAIQRLRFDDLRVTVSVGVSANTEAPRTPQALLDQTECSLKFAQASGKNQTARHDALPSNFSPNISTPSWIGPEITSTIPFPAVTALISALAYRDPATAAHSRRVADLAVAVGQRMMSLSSTPSRQTGWRVVAVGQRMMSLSSCYILETAALLHDIGKIGVPDSILLKPTALTADEWAVMHTHDRIGLEIIRASFGAEALSSIVENYTRQFKENLPEAESLPLGARILAVADAYDSMTSDQRYRPAMSPAEAMSELRRCAGSQFDPEIVNQFIEIQLTRGSDGVPRVEVGRAAALALGLELERLAEAVDQQDLKTLTALASRLSATASHHGAPEIAARAKELEAATSLGDDVLGILRTANELLMLCRASQRSYVAPAFERLDQSSLDHLELERA